MEHQVIEDYTYEAVQLPVDNIVFVGITTFILTITFMIASRYGDNHELLAGKPQSISRKFAESCYNFVIYVILAGWGLYVIFLEDWPLETKHLFLGWPNHDMGDLFRYYYLFQFSFYLQQSIVLLVLTERKKDFMEYLIHHVVTLSLIGVSYFTWKIRFGLAILSLHDVSDVFLHLAKSFHYAERENSTNSVFAVFALFFFITRLLIFPNILWSIWFEAQQYVSPSILEEQKLEYGFWKYLLLILQILHLIWFYYVMKVVIESVKNNGVQGDVRSDDESMKKKQ